MFWFLKALELVNCSKWNKIFFLFYIFMYKPGHLDKQSSSTKQDLWTREDTHRNITINSIHTFVTANLLYYVVKTPEFIFRHTTIYGFVDKHQWQRVKCVQIYAVCSLIKRYKNIYKIFYCLWTHISLENVYKNFGLSIKMTKDQNSKL